MGRWATVAAAGGGCAATGGDVVAVAAVFARSDERLASLADLTTSLRAAAEARGFAVSAGSAFAGGGAAPRAVARGSGVSLEGEFFESSIGAVAAFSLGAIGDAGFGWRDRASTITKAPIATASAIPAQVLAWSLRAAGGGAIVGTDELRSLGARGGPANPIAPLDAIHASPTAIRSALRISRAVW